MWRFGNDLVVVQNGTSPMQIAAFELPADDTEIVGHRVLERANQDWTEPLGGSLDGDSLIYVGNGQWDRFVDGRRVDGKPPLPTEIRRLSLKPQYTGSWFWTMESRGSQRELRDLHEPTLAPWGTGY